MSDIYTRSERSFIMSKISNKETKPEILVRKYLFSRGFRYRKNAKELPGKPDIILPKYKTAIFVHGCFWHGHEGCRKSQLPTSNIEFWTEKIGKNKERDQKEIQNLHMQGWKVIIVWQCEIKNKILQKERLEQLVLEIRQ